VRVGDGGLEAGQRGLEGLTAPVQQRRGVRARRGGRRNVADEVARVVAGRRGGGYGRTGPLALPTARTSRIDWMVEARAW
jgi:hypothetical protein